jgi:pSer/pThr/pTyr-binding forkhead associated (FHA) protein
MSGIVLLIFRLAAAALLYIFLGWAFLTLWKELKLQSEKLSAQQLPNLVLQIENATSPARTYHQAELLVGRDPSCDVLLVDESVSARHARLSYHHTQWWAEDLKSTNGTQLNHDPITTPTVVMSGDILRCGIVSIVIKINNQINGGSS